jgi:hypothetical protein
MGTEGYSRSTCTAARSTAREPVEYPGVLSRSTLLEYSRTLVGGEAREELVERVLGEQPRLVRRAHRDRRVHEHLALELLRALASPWEPRE